jgi:hypothetical protein
MYSFRVADHTSATINLNHALIDHALGEILIRGPDAYLFNVLI